MGTCVRRAVHNRSTGLVPFLSTGPVGENDAVVVRLRPDTENKADRAQLALPRSWPNLRPWKDRFDMEEGNRGAVGDAIAEAKIRLEQALAYLDRYPDNVLALESAIVQCRAAILLLECPVEE